MNPGRLDTKISILQPSETATNAVGGRVSAESFKEFTTRKAEVKHLRGQELERAQALNSEIESKITVRYDSKTKLIRSDWRAQHGADVYHITHVIPVPGGSRSTRIELYCRLNG